MRFRCLAQIAPWILSAAAVQATTNGVVVSSSAHNDVLPALRNLKPRAPIAGANQPMRHVAGSRRSVPRGPASSAAPVIRGPVDATIGLNFGGLGDGYPGTIHGSPSDANGSVGATQYVQIVNTSFAVFSKSTGALVYGPSATNSLWQGFGGPCEITDDGDGSVVYDKIARRWVITQFSVSLGPPYYQCVAVSQTSDAGGAYNRYSFTFTDFNDYTKIGVWPDAYYMTFNMFTGQTFLGAQVCALDRARMLTGQPATMQCVQLGAQYYSLLPADLEGYTLPPAGAPNYLIADDLQSFQLDLWKFHVDWAIPANSSLSGPVTLPYPAYTGACNSFVIAVCVPQLGTAQLLDSIGNQLMNRASYRNFGDHESIFTNESVGFPLGIQWYELQNPGGASPTLAQIGLFNPDSDNRWMGSIASDRKGNLALGYSVSSAAVHPGIRFTGRTPSTPLNTMLSEKTIFDGGGSQINGLDRWGDYFNMAIDPVDDCTFWFTAQYLKFDGSFNWATRIATLKFPGCNTAPTLGPVTPSGGSGTSVTFALKYNDVDGASDINVAYFLVNSVLDGMNACLVAYSRYDNLLYLFANSGAALVAGSLTPGVAGTLSNGQCTISGAGTSVGREGNTMTLNAAVTFQPNFVGTKNIYTLVADLGGLTAGWTQEATWTPSSNAAPTVGALTPNPAIGASLTLTTTYSDANGYTDLALVYVLINGGLDGAGACFYALNRPANQVYLVADSGSGLVPGSLTPGQGGTLSNSQCTIAVSALPSAAGNTLSFPVDVTFNPGFLGQKTVFGLAVDSNLAIGGWQAMGTWQRTVNQPPTVTSVTPASGAGSSQIFTLIYADPNGYQDLAIGYVLFNSGLNGANGCYVAYNRPINLLYLVNDAGNGLVNGTVTPGQAGSLTNSQCTLSSGGTASGSGNSLTLPVMLQFKPAFAGPKLVYMLAADTAGALANWTQMGTWTAQ